VLRPAWQFRSIATVAGALRRGPIFWKQAHYAPTAFSQWLGASLPARDLETGARAALLANLPCAKSSAQISATTRIRVEQQRDAGKSALPRQQAVHAKLAQRPIRSELAGGFCAMHRRKRCADSGSCHNWYSPSLAEMSSVHVRRSSCESLLQHLGH